MSVGAVDGDERHRRRHVLGLLRRRWLEMAVLVPLAVMEMAFEGALTLSYKLLIDNAIVPGDGRALVIILSALGGGVVLTSLLALWRDYLFAGFLSRILNDVRRAAFDHCQRLSVGFYARRPTADLLARFSTDIAGLESWLSGAVTGFLLPGIGLIIGTSLLFFVLEWHVALIGTLIWPLVLIGPRLIAPRAANAAYSKKQAEAKALATIEETIEAQRIIKAYGLSSLARRKFDGDIAALGRNTSRAGFLSFLVERSTVTTIYCVQVGAVAVGAFMAYRGQLSVGSLVSFLTLFWNLGWLLVVVGRTAPSLVSAASSMRRIDELLDEESDTAGANEGSEALPLRTSIRFENVIFGYEPGKPVLKGISFEIRRGESVAFVGASGSGKSTVLNLLTRFYDAEQGRILFDEIDVKELSAASLRSQMGLVSQESFLFDMTIRENIRLGRLDASDEQIELAAQSAEIHEAIQRMPGTYERNVGERGSMLSGGERQRISLARALLRNPPILLLDEASSALDPATEAAVNETLSRAGRGRTTIAVTHRLASVTSVDRVFVMEQGRIVERGTHRELLEQNGAYAELWRKQDGFVVSRDGLWAHVTPERLRDLPFLAPLTETQRASLVGLFACEKVSAGQTIFREGDEGRLFYFIVRGSVSISRRDERDEDVELVRLSDGDHFGELALLHDAPRNATVTARKDCLFLTLTRESFLDLIHRTPNVRAIVEQMASGRVAKPLPPRKVAVS